MPPTAAAVIADLELAADPGEAARIATRVAPGEPVIGVRMGTLFAIAKAGAAMPLDEVESLMADARYEPRMAAFCILDFAARRRLGDEALFRCYLDHHDRITAWDMVDRAAPRVVGAHEAGGDGAVLHELAGSDDSLRRRTAVTAPLWFVRHGSDADVAVALDLAARLHADDDPIVTNAVGILLGHLGASRPDLVVALLDRIAPTMPRPAVRLAARNLGEARSRFVG